MLLVLACYPALEKDRQEERTSSAIPEVQGQPLLHEQRWGRREEADDKHTKQNKSI